MKDKKRRNVTLAEIAHAAGVSRMTASLALRNLPRTSHETRRRVLAAARQLGYVPNARLSTIMALRRQADVCDPVPVAWLNTSCTADAWRVKRYLSPYFEGASARCAELGYRLEEFWLRSRGMTGPRLSKILFHRGIRGVIITPANDWNGMGDIRLDWEQFACVSFEERVLLAPKIPRIAQDRHYNLLLTLQRLRRCGYRRIGVSISGQSERWSAHSCRAAVTYFHTRLPKAERVPYFVHHLIDDAGDDFFKWMRRYAPDVVIGQHSGLVDWVRTAGWRVPQDVGVVHCALDEDCSSWAGIWANKREIGALAIDSVVSRLQKNEFGLPSHRHDILVPGHWQEGQTLLSPKTNRPVLFT